MDDLHIEEPFPDLALDSLRTSWTTVEGVESSWADRAGVRRR